MGDESFTNQQPRVATERDLELPWSGSPSNFRCYLCGHRFRVGDVWRFVYGNMPGGPGNFLVCESCDGEDVLEKKAAMNAELKAILRDLRRRFWWHRRRAGED